MTITAEMIRQCRIKIDGVVIADENGHPKIRSAIHYKGSQMVAPRGVVRFHHLRLTNTDFQEEK